MKLEIDVYTKGLLTVIAIALSVIALHQVVGVKHAIGQIGGGCGESSSEACYVRTGSRALDVRAR